MSINLQALADQRRPPASGGMDFHSAARGCVKAVAQNSPALPLAANLFSIVWDQWAGPFHRGTGTVLW